MILPRILDKCRALLAGRQGEYKFACPLDQRWFDLMGIDPETLKTEVSTGKSDTEILAWAKSNAKNKPSDADIAAWSAHEEARTPGNVESREYFNELHKKVAPQREDVVTWFDLLDVDDYASFGGRP